MSARIWSGEVKRTKRYELGRKLSDQARHCVILMAGARSEDPQVHYPVSELAARSGASVDEEAPTGDTPTRRSSRQSDGDRRTGVASPGLSWRRFCSRTRPRWRGRATAWPRP
jgi:hypothetical protein